MNENKVPCGGFKVDTEFFGVEEGKLYFRPESINDYGFMHGYCATLRQDVDEGAATVQWIMDKDDIRAASMNAINGVPVFVQIMMYLSNNEGKIKYAYSTGNLCYYEKDKKLIFSCPYSEGVTFSIKFYDVNINTGIATVTTKELS